MGGGEVGFTTEALMSDWKAGTVLMWIWWVRTVHPDVQQWKAGLQTGFSIWSNKCCGLLCLWPQSLTLNFPPASRFASNNLLYRRENSGEWGCGSLAHSAASLHLLCNCFWAFGLLTGKHSNRNLCSCGLCIMPPCVTQWQEREDPTGNRFDNSLCCVDAPKALLVIGFDNSLCCVDTQKTPLVINRHWYSVGCHGSVVA